MNTENEFAPSSLEKLQGEILEAKALAETMRVLYTASFGCDSTEMELNDIVNCLWHIWGISETHVERLETICDELFQEHNKKG